MTSPTKPNPGTRVLLGVLAFCSLVALTVGPLLVVRYREASRVLSDYSRSLVHGDFRAAYAQLSPQAQATLPFDRFVSQQKTLQQRIGRLR